MIVYHLIITQRCLKQSSINYYRGLVRKTNDGQIIGKNWNWIEFIQRYQNYKPINNDLLPAKRKRKNSEKPVTPYSSPGKFGSAKGVHSRKGGGSLAFGNRPGKNDAAHAKLLKLDGDIRELINRSYDLSTENDLRQTEEKLLNLGAEIRTLKRKNGYLRVTSILSELKSFLHSDLKEIKGRLCEEDDFSWMDSYQYTTRKKHTSHRRSVSRHRSLNRHASPDPHIPHSPFKHHTSRSRSRSRSRSKSNLNKKVK